MNKEINSVKYWSSGFTVVEILVGIAIVSIVFFSTITMLNKMATTEKIAEVTLNNSVIRNQIINHILDSRGWKNMVQSENNSFLNCMKNLDLINASDRNCVGQHGTLNIYDNHNSLIYNFSNPSLGFDSNGGICTNFVAPPNPGNPACPLHLDLMATALCEQSPCINPTFKITGTFTYNGTSEIGSFSLPPMNFEIFRTNFYCPDQTGPITLNNISNTTTFLSPLQVISSEAGAISSSGSAKTSTLILPCRNVQIKFRDNMNVSALVSRTDAGNRSSFCIYNTETNACEFQYKRIYAVNENKIELYYKDNLLLTTNATFAPISSSSEFEFRIKNGIVQFCIDQYCIYNFSAAVDFPFEARFYPAGSSYSPTGFNEISFSYY